MTLPVGIVVIGTGIQSQSRRQDQRYAISKNESIFNSESELCIHRHSYYTMVHILLYMQCAISVVSAPPTLYAEDDLWSGFEMAQPATIFIVFTVNKHNKYTNHIHTQHLFILKKRSTQH